MRHIPAVTWSILALAIAYALAGSAFSQDRSEPARLAECLGDRDYRDRKAAGKRLDELGAEALPALRQVAASGNLEASERATALIAKIEKRIANAKAIAGTMVELKAEEQTLGAALDSLRKQTGYNIELVGEQKPLLKALMPKGGKTIFWEGLQDLLDKSGLEVGPVGPAVSDAGTVFLRPREAKVTKPHSISGAFLIEVLPVTDGDLAAMPASRVAAQLRIVPEPRIRWEGATRTLIAHCRDRSDRSLTWDFKNIDPPKSAPPEFGQHDKGPNRDGVFDWDWNLKFPLPRTTTPVKLIAASESPDCHLKALGGIVCGQVWGESEVLVTLSGLSKKPAEVEGSYGTNMAAVLETNHSEESALYLHVNVKHPVFEVRHYQGAKPIPVRTSSTFDLATAGVSLFDGHGKSMKLEPSGRGLIQSEGTGTAAKLARRMSYDVKPTDADALSQPGSITFSASVLKNIEIPFYFKDLSVSTGGGIAPPPVRELERGK